VQALTQMGRKEDALARVEQWLAKHPEHRRGLFLKGNLMIHLGRLEQAKNLLQGLLETDPNNPLILNNLALLLKKSDPAKARAYATRAVELEPGYRTWDTLGVILLEQGETADSVDLLKRALAAQPESPDIRFSLARGLAASGEPEQARALVNELLADAGTDFLDRERAEQFLAGLKTR
jgi:tetratricopeptide (TPR) repeat protein